MRLHVALEAFAFRIGKGQAKKGKNDVRDKKRWKAWVKANEAVIRGHAVVGREDALFQKVMGSSRLSSGKVVPDAFAAHGIDVTDDMKAELPGRDFAVHQGSMALDDQYNADRDIRRVAVVRTMLVALVAKAVGYGGAINGWDIGQQGWPIEAANWWTINEADRQEARRMYVAQETSS